MDLGAYALIGTLDEIAKKNNISVPRLRGYRLMKDEEPLDIQEIINDRLIEECEMLIEKGWYVNSCCYTIDDATRRNKKKYMTYHVKYDEWPRDDGSVGLHKHYVYDGIKWDKIHGKHRKALKLAIKQMTKRVKKQYEVWNRYCGRDDILYIHSRIGGNNWSFYDGDNTVAKQIWFLEKVDDSDDCTYCDIYALIGKETINE